MNKKSGMSKIALILIIALVVIVIVAAVVGVIFVLKNNNNKPVEVYEEPIDIYNDTTEFVEEIIENSENESLEPLDKTLTEFRNDEYGVRFGYPIGMELPVDNLDTDNFFHSIIKKENSTKNIELFVGELDNLSAKGEYLNEKIDSLKEKAGNVEISYGLLGNQMSVRLKYEIEGIKYYQNVTIKEKTAYGLIYAADKDEYDNTEADRVFNSFCFVNNYRDYPTSAEREVIIDGEKYTLPVKVSTIKGLSINPKYSNEILKPNYFSIVSLYETKNIKYSAYVYNAKASNAEVNTGYVIGIETDKFRGGDLEIIGGIKIGTLLSEVRDTLGLPKNEYKNEDGTELVNTYVVNDATIELKYKTTDGTQVNESTPVYGISIKFKR
ncbi:MAG: hypothetical protein Q4D02_06485 [Clostridia bacterium]|nr:hypothetical protein [Clostridia bacterium]